MLNDQMSKRRVAVALAYWSRSVRMVRIVRVKREGGGMLSKQWREEKVEDAVFEQWHMSPVQLHPKTGYDSTCHNPSSLLSLSTYNHTRFQKHNESKLNNNLFRMLKFTYGSNQ